MGTKLLSRNVILAAGSVTGMGCGAIYMWSIFNKPLMDLFGYSTSEVSFAYSLFLLFTCIAGWLAGWLQQHVQLRFIVLGAGVLFGLGWLLTGFADSLVLLYVFFGCFAGSGNGLLYNTILAVVAKWFPDKRGFANGVCVGAIGLAPLVFAPMGNWLIESFDVQTAFRFVGVVWLVVYLVFSWLLYTPPAGWAPDGRLTAPPEEPGEEGSHQASSGELQKMEVNVSPRQMVRSPLYYLLFLTLMAATTSGLMITGHASNIGQEMAGLTAAEGALTVSVLSLGNFIGRFGFGYLSDYLGRYETMLVVLALNALTMLAILPHAYGFVLFLISVGLVGACFGGTFTLVPAIVADVFGSRYFGANYSLVYPGDTVAAFVGPMLAAFMVESSGAYVPAFYVAGAISLVGIVLVWGCRMLERRAKRA